MGHERVGFLPKTKRWLDLIKQMESLYSEGISASSVAAETLANVRHQYARLGQDDAVKKIFSFLVTFSRACRFDNPFDELKAAGFPVPGEPSLIAIVKILKEQMPAHQVASEYGQLAFAAASDAIGQWYRQNATNQQSLFEPTDGFLESWRYLGNGAGFCELTRLFFGKLTERYLNYFLDRVATSQIPSIQRRERFQRDIRVHVEDVSKHAFETAKITQSFAAGWFNSHTRDTFPDDKEIEGFLAIAFGKLRDELRREKEAK